MSAVRQLSVIYLIVASAFTASIISARNPELAPAIRHTAHVAYDGTAVTVKALNRYALKPGWALAQKEAGALHEAIHEAIANALRSKQTQIAVKQSPKPKAVAARAKPQHVATAEPSVTLTLKPPKSAPVPQGEPHVLRLEREASIPPAPPKSAGLQTAAEIARVEQRLKDSLTSEMFDHFELFLYVSKADKGPWAQHMFVFKKTGKKLAMLYDWPVSTGREKIEYNDAGLKLPTYTPRGYYELDRHRFYAHYRSLQWGQPMPYAMFFRWEKDGVPTGLAIHGATGADIDLLGTRSSAGCIRLAPENAALLQSLIQSKYKGLMPKFAFDKKTYTISNDGMMAHAPNGRLRMVKGYKVLVFIENYGGENVVAALF